MATSLVFQIDQFFLSLVFLDGIMDFRQDEICVCDPEECVSCNQAEKA